jgi:hypothetical protein
VFVIVLASPGYEQAFGAATQMPYLAHTLRPRGTLLPNYRLLDSADVPNYLAMISGQAPNSDTKAGCETYADFPAATKPDRQGAVSGSGCIYPVGVLTVADQITSSGRRWRAYLEDMSSGPAGATSCRHPQPGGLDDTQDARPGDQYAVRHNPFAYFHSLLDLGDCLSNDVDLAKLAPDLRSAKTTPNLVYVAPNLCDDGTDTPCVDGRPGGPGAADAFLARWVPQIMRSPAYRQDGLLAIAFGRPARGDTSRRTGALLLSRWLRPGSSDPHGYDPYGLLRSIEDVFGLDHLAHANDDATGTFASSLPQAAGARAP